jgi:cytochrome c
LRDILIFGTALFILIGCHTANKSFKDGHQASETIQPAEALSLIAKSDCNTCHKIEERVVGPSWTEVANRYTDSKKDVEYLSSKIKNGGKGKWGEMPMVPHPMLTRDEAKTIVLYLLTLKTNK